MKNTVHKEGFAVQTPSSKPGIDPMFEKGPELPSSVSSEMKKYWSSFCSSLNNKIGYDFKVSKIISKSTSDQIFLINKYEESYLKSITVYHDWTKDGNQNNPITVLQLETEDGDVISKLGKLTIDPDPDFYLNNFVEIIDNVLEKENMTLVEKAKSKAQQRLFGIAAAMQSGKMKPSGAAGEIAKTVKPSEVQKFAKTKTEDLPETIKEESKQMKTENKKTKLKIALLKEQLTKLTGKKVILKEGIERVTIDQMNKILSNLPPQEKIALYMITKVGMNKNIIDADGNKIPNPFYDKVIKKNIVYGRVNFNYGEEFKNATNQDYVANSESKRTLGVKQGAISMKDGKARLPLVDIEYDTPTYEVNGNEISKEELKPYLKPANSSNTGSITMIAPNLENVKKIAIGTKEYQII